MSYPTKYTRQYDFQGYQVSNPTRPLPGNQVNIDLNAVKQSVGEIVDFLKGPIRADGQLANGSVGVDQLNPNLNLGFSLPTTWEAGVDYTTDSTVFYANKFWKANVAHTSTDGFDESKWTVIVDFGEQATAAAASAAAAAQSETNTATDAATVASQVSTAVGSAAAAATSETNAAASSASAGASAATATAAASEASTTLSDITAQVGTAFGKRVINRVNNTKSIWDYLDDDPNTTPGAVNTAWEALVVDAGAAPRMSVVFPAYDYQLTRTIKIPTGSRIAIECDESWTTRFLAHASGNWGTGGGQSDRMFGPSDTDYLDTFRWRGGVVLGNTIAPYGLRFDKAVHGVYDHLEIIGTTAWALLLNGYSNRITNPQIWGNVGGLNLSGVRVTEGLGNSNTNIEGGIIYANTGIGARISNGWGVKMSGIGIEGNDVAGIVAWDVRGLFIGNGAYFERNGKNKYSFTTAGGSPEALSVQADIFLLGNNTGELSGYDSTAAARSVVVDGCSFSPYGAFDFPTAGLGQNCAVFATALENLRITNNDISSPGHMGAMVGTYNNNVQANCTNLVIEGNDDNNVIFLGTGNSNFSFSSAHNISNRFQQPCSNYAPQDLASYLVLSGTTGGLTDNSTKYGRFSVWAMTAGDKLHGFAVDLSAHPELLGKYVWFGVNFQRLNTNTNLRVWAGGHTDQDGTILLTGTSGGVWEQRSVMTYIAPTDTTLYCAFEMNGASGTILLSSPMLAVVGNSAPDVMRAP